MGDKIVLRMRYIHLEKLEIEVDDPDRCTILDIFVDLLEGAAKKGMILPEEPTLWYAHESQSFKLESDNDLMRMFSLFHDQKLIKLAIGSDETPCKNLELARGLIESKRRLESTSVEAHLLQIPVPPKSSHASASFHSDLSGSKIPKIGLLTQNLVDVGQMQMRLMVIISALAGMKYVRMYNFASGSFTVYF